jgi:hypothetical protein
MAGKLTNPKSVQNGEFVILPDLSVKYFKLKFNVQFTINNHGNSAKHMFESIVKESNVM